MSEGKLQTHKYFAAMTCGGCSSAIQRILKFVFRHSVSLNIYYCVFPSIYLSLYHTHTNSKIEGVTDIVTDVEAKEVTLTIPNGELLDTITAKLTKWGTHDVFVCV
jgi:copper chaperone CopZ